MSFVGQFGSTWKGFKPPGSAVAFAVGFTISAWTSIFLLHLAGLFANRFLPVEYRYGLLSTFVFLILMLDARQSSARCSIGLHRQTPDFYRFSRIGTLLWGFDTGIPITTVRLTALPLIGMAAAALGFGPSNAGFLYAAGFLGGVAFHSSKIIPATLIPGLVDLRDRVHNVRASSQFALAAYGALLAIMAFQ